MRILTLIAIFVLSILGSSVFAQYDSRDLPQDVLFTEQVVIIWLKSHHSNPLL